MADRVAVMYAGIVVEESPVASLFDNPYHPYTIGLIGSVPVMGEVRERLDVIPGSVPNLINLPPGCRFAPRCMGRLEHNLSICTEKRPNLTEVAKDHRVRCWLYEDSEQHTAPLKNGRYTPGNKV
jgi:oligopeptide/dipeptide ABC transporter ATP-binding protein